MKSRITDRFDAIFWAGDFNYRVNQTKANTIEFLKTSKFAVSIMVRKFLIILDLT